MSATATLTHTKKDEIKLLVFKYMFWFFVKLAHWKSTGSYYRIQIITLLYWQSGYRKNYPTHQIPIYLQNGYGVRTHVTPIHLDGGMKKNLNARTIMAKVIPSFLDGFAVDFILERSLNMNESEKTIYWLIGDVLMKTALISAKKKKKKLQAGRRRVLLKLFVANTHRTSSSS